MSCGSKYFQRCHTSPMILFSSSRATPLFTAHTCPGAGNIPLLLLVRWIHPDTKNVKMKRNPGMFKSRKYSIIFVKYTLPKSSKDGTECSYAYSPRYPVPLICNMSRQYDTFVETRVRILIHYYQLKSRLHLNFPSFPLTSFSVPVSSEL